MVLIVVDFGDEIAVCEVESGEIKSGSHKGKVAYRFHNSERPRVVSKTEFAKRRKEAKEFETGLDVSYT